MLTKKDDAMPMVGVMRSEFSSVFDSIGCAMVREYGLQKTHVT